MSTLTLPPRPQAVRPPLPRDDRPGTHQLFPSEEVGWLGVEAAARMAAAGDRPSVIGPDEASPLARLVRDPRLAAFATSLAGMPRRPVLARLGQPRTLPEPDDLVLFVEISGQGSLPGLVHTGLGAIAAGIVVLAVAFDAGAQPATGQDDVAPDGLWPPAAVVAG
jgi:hypothetical protein